MKQLCFISLFALCINCHAQKIGYVDIHKLLEAHPKYEIAIKRLKEPYPEEDTVRDMFDQYTRIVSSSHHNSNYDTLKAHANRLNNLQEKISIYQLNTQEKYERNIKATTDSVYTDIKFQIAKFCKEKSISYMLIIDENSLGIDSLNYTDSIISKLKNTN